MRGNERDGAARLVANLYPAIFKGYVGHVVKDVRRLRIKHQKARAELSLRRKPFVRGSAEHFVDIHGFPMRNVEGLGGEFDAPSGAGIAAIVHPAHQPGKFFAAEYVAKQQMFVGPEDSDVTVGSRGIDQAGGQIERGSVRRHCGQVDAATLGEWRERPDEVLFVSELSGGTGFLGTNPALCSRNVDDSISR